MEMNVCFPKILRAFDLKHFIKSLLLSREKSPYGKHCFVITRHNLNDPMFMIYLWWWRGEKSEGPSCTIHAVKASLSAAFAVLNKMCWTSEVPHCYLFSYPLLRNLTKQQTSLSDNSFPGHKGLCDLSIQCISSVLFVCVLSMHAAFRSQYVLE